MGSESKVLVQNRELSNLYEDIAEDILNNLVFDSSNVDHVNQLLFVSMMENAISYLADDVFDSFNKSETKISNLNSIHKWISLKQFKFLENLIEQELKDDGLFYLFTDAKSKLFEEVDVNLILSNKGNSLKKFNSILNKYKSFKDLLRKVLDEC